MKTPKSNFSMKCPLQKGDISFTETDSFLQSLSEIKKKYQDSSSYSQKNKLRIYSDILNLLEKLCSHCRHFLNEDDESCDENVLLCQDYSEDNCSVQVSNQYFFSVKMPLPVRRNKEYSWYLYKCLFLKIRSFAEKNPEFSFSIPNKKFFIIFRRHLASSKKVFPDNDNIEAKRIVNLICSAFYVADGVDNMKFISTAIRDTEDYLEVILLPEQELSAHLDLIIDKP